MVEFIYDELKDTWLKENRGVSFRMVISILEGEGEHRVIPNPNQNKYKNGQAYLVMINDYACIVPFEEEGDKIRLKTIFRDRKINRRYHDE